MKTAHGATELEQTIGSTRRVSSFFKNYWGGFQECHQRKRFRADLHKLNRNHTRRRRLRRPPPSRLSVHVIELVQNH
jgi:hypothetical protein